VARKKAIADLASLHNYDLMNKADNGSTEALELLATRCKENPSGLLFIGDMARNARDSRIRQMMGDKAEGSQLVLQKKTADIVKSVAGNEPNPLERLLAERIGMCWLDVQHHECLYAQTNNERTHEWRSRMLDRAHNRYMSAIKTFATVRRLNLPIVQVNIPEKQINTVGPGALATPQGEGDRQSRSA